MNAKDKAEFKLMGCAIAAAAGVLVLVGVLAVLAVPWVDLAAQAYFNWCREITK